MPLREEPTEHLAGLANSFAGEAEPLVVEGDGGALFHVPVFEADDDSGGHYEVHPWQFAGPHVGPFLGIDPKPSGSAAEVSFNGVTIRLPDGRWMTFIDSGHVMAQLGVMPGRAVSPQPQGT